jgi:hypothetical protein
MFVHPFGLSRSGERGPRDRCGVDIAAGALGRRRVHPATVMEHRHEQDLRRSHNRVLLLRPELLLVC